MSDYSVKQAASLFSVCEETVRRMIDRGELRAYRVGMGPLRIAHESIDAYRNRTATKRGKTGPNPAKKSLAR